MRKLLRILVFTTGLFPVVAQAQPNYPDWASNGPALIGAKNGIAGLDANARVNSDISGDLRYSTTARTDAGYYVSVSDDVCPASPWVSNPKGSGWVVGDLVTVPNDGSTVKITSVDSSGAVTGISLVTPGSSAINATNLCGGIPNPHGTGSGYAELYLQPTSMKFVPYATTTPTATPGYTASLGDIFSSSSPPTAQQLMYAVFNQPFSFIKNGTFSWPKNLTLTNFKHPKNGVVSSGVIDFLGSNNSTLATTVFDPVSKSTIPYVGDSYLTITNPSFSLPTILYSRADKGNVNNTAPMIDIKLLDDDPVNGANSIGFAPRNAMTISSVVTENAVSSARNLGLDFEDHGMGFYSQQNYAFQNVVHKYGLDWIWAQADEIDELGGMDFSYTSRATDKGPSTVEFMAEHNLNGTGIEDDETLYASKNQRRVNQLASHGMYANYVPWWAANTQYQAHQMIRWVDSTTGYQYMFTTDTGGKSGATEPDFGSHETQYVKNATTINTLTVHNGGTGYAVNDVVAMNNYVSVKITGVNGSGAVTSIGITYMTVIPKTAYDTTIHQNTTSGGGSGLTLDITFNTVLSDTITDGTVTWIPLGVVKYQVGTAYQASAGCTSVTYPTGYSGPTQNHCIEVGTAFAMSGNIYNTMIDGSLINYTNQGIHSWARTVTDSYIDLSADGTRSGINNHIFGYGSWSGLGYGIKTSGDGASAKYTWPLVIGDNSHVHLDNGLINTDGAGNLSVGSLSTTALTYATLPSSPVTGQHIFCSDCYSKLREDGDTATGILVYWNGTRWNDVLGIAAQH